MPKIDLSYEKLRISLKLIFSIIFENIFLKTIF